MEKANDTLQKVFTNAKYHPELSLTDDIWHAIVVRQQRIQRIKFWSYSFVGAFSLVSLFPVLASLFRQFVESGFSEYLSLVFSDSGSIVLYWKELVLTIADSLPTTSLILSLALLFVFLLCVRRAARYVKSPVENMKYA